MNAQPDAQADRRRRFSHVAIAVAVGLAVMGFFVGIHQDGTPEVEAREMAGHAAPEGDGPPRVVSYSEMASRDLGPNATWETPLAKLRDGTPDVWEAVEVDEARKQASLEERAANRAYDGAPPTVPHPIDQMSAASCLACHADGKQIGSRTASPIPHPPYANCTQCHVESDNRKVSPAWQPRANSFTGASAPEGGERAWAGAPPTIPHSTWMRQDCASCHGVNGDPGIRTSHPWRANCTQCHGVSAEMDQRTVQGNSPFSSMLSDSFNWNEARDE